MSNHGVAFPFAVAGLIMTASRIDALRHSPAPSHARPACSSLSRSRPRALAGVRPHRGCRQVRSSSPGGRSVSPATSRCGEQQRRHRVLQLHRLRAQRASPVSRVPRRHLATDQPIRGVDRVPVGRRPARTGLRALRARSALEEAAVRHSGWTNPAGVRRVRTSFVRAQTTRSSAIRWRTSTSRRCGPTRFRPPPTTCSSCGRAAGRRAIRSVRRFRAPASRS